ncbi:lipoate-protein ligase B [Anaplasma marginale str. Dawn]|uniref:lipoyl(octanoyl) transferase LipB n=1 Tax=Anaplasma marginale TaxID=770 RepID=UPI0003C27883|nr:lipoyl(octanoyl) transferase LipB [Anaplasma marginale]AGZ79052.1 lipoate-protein ligase B [Anaplasma marginale str. Gypsy Plains]AGZ79862.1 lipoate-protein ligase B [Anaplasma marginale str. Dawn]AXW84261.1 lipoate-protein ligase B [Anaplasma marginale]AXW85185.1 lipoate-protein ligase B [Anaplasma marginale]
MSLLGFPVEWRVSDGMVDYKAALDFMTSRVYGILEGRESEMVWLLEHPSVYTAGVSAKDGELLSENKFQVVRTTRGGKYSYHGPGQRVVYVMLHLGRRDKRDVRLYVRNLGLWVVGTLAEFGIDSHFDDDNTGVWVQYSRQAKKIAAFGIAIRRWVTYHGFSVNISTDLGCYSGIVPCGIAGSHVTSLQDLGVTVTFEEFDAVLQQKFDTIFLQ